MTREPVAVIGGDERERQLIVALSNAGYRVLCAGRELGPAEIEAGAQTVPATTALAARVVVGPLPGIIADGRVWSRPPHQGLTLDPQTVLNCPSGGLWLSGAIREPVATHLRDRAIDHLNLADHDELAILNSIPSAEGAIMLAMQESPTCLHGASVVVLGYGRTAQTLAWMLKGLGSRVTVVARSRAAQARASAAGLEACAFTALATAMAGAEFGFNTVPAMVLPAQVINQAPPDLVLIDLASAPGGTDFEAAKSRGIKAMLAPGLPGLVAPRTAGRYLARVVLALLKERGI